MKISEKFKLNKSQYELDFIDIDPSVDLPLFIDPYFLAQRTDGWSVEASRTTRNFFQYLVTLLASGRITKARTIFRHLNEPNETCLGLSKKEPQGRGIGTTDTDNIFNSLLESKAVETGLVEDLEDCRIFVDGIDKDKTSDMTTNIIRKHLIDYTVQQCNLWNITWTQNVPSGFFWNRQEREWQNIYTQMLVIDERKILLVPKAIASYRSEYTPQKYYRQFILNYLQHEQLRLDTILVKRRRNEHGDEVAYVTKKDVKSQFPFSKEFLRKFTEDHPDVFHDFKNVTAERVSPLDDEELGAPDLTEIIDYLINQSISIQPGSAFATQYHRLVVGILELLFYPSLVCPQVEREIHDGRKRIDITFDNAAHNGFFYRLHTTHKTPAQFIFVECKNYSEDPANPELDQLAGRFALHRGLFGLLLCRTIENMDLFLARCADTYRDGRGIVLPLVDSDLMELLNGLKSRQLDAAEGLLAERFRAIALR